MQSALQVQGISQWGVTLLSINSAEPAGRENVPHICQKTWSKYCLDGTGLNASGVKAILAVGIILIVAAITGVLVWLDVRRRSGKVRGCLCLDTTQHSLPCCTASPAAALKCCTEAAASLPRMLQQLCSAHLQP